MNVRIDRATRGQLPLLTNFVKAFHELEEIHLTDDRREHAIGSLIDKPDLGGIWLIYDDSFAIGYIAICKGFSIEFGGYDGFLDEFYIVPELRGKGVGATVLGLIKEEAQRMGLQALHLEVAKTNHRARKLYDSLGFVARDKYVLLSVSTNS